MSLFSVVFFLVGLSMTALGIATGVEGRRRNAWPVARGTVAAGELLEIDGHFMGVVRYRYALAPVSAYRGTDHSMEGRLESPPCLDRREAEAHLQKYPVGERIDVRYDPARPTRSALGPVRRAPFAGWLAFVGLTIAVVSAVVALQ